MKYEQVIMCFGGFRHTSWEQDYAGALAQVAAQTAMERESALDFETLLYIIHRSTDHHRAETEIAKGYTRVVAAYLEEQLNLGISVRLTRYHQSEVYGALSMRCTETELISIMEDKMVRRCGALPDLTDPTDGIPVFEWLIWCLDIMKSGDPTHIPDEDQVMAMLAEQHQRTGAAKKAIEMALDRKKVQAFLDRPVDTILERVLRG